MSIPPRNSFTHTYYILACCDRVLHDCAIIRSLAAASHSALCIPHVVTLGRFRLLINTTLEAADLRRPFPSFPSG